MLVVTWRVRSEDVQKLDSDVLHVLSLAVYIYRRVPYNQLMQGPDGSTKDKIPV